MYDALPMIKAYQAKKERKRIVDDSLAGLFFFLIVLMGFFALWLA